LNSVTKKGTIVSKMSTVTNINNISAALFGKTRRAVLSLLYSHTDEAFYLRQIARAAGVGLGAVQRELRQLSDAGIIQRTVKGKQVYYQANEKCPIFNELKSVVRKTFDEKIFVIGDEGELQKLKTSAVSMQSYRFVVPKAKLAEFCRQHHIKKLSLFGSALRDDFRSDSDIDVLVEFEPGYVPGFGIIDMENDLSKLAGRKVDLRTPKDLSRYFRDRVVQEAKVEYAEA